MDRRRKIDRDWKKVNSGGEECSTIITGSNIESGGRMGKWDGGRKQEREMISKVFNTPVYGYGCHFTLYTSF